MNPLTNMKNVLKLSEQELKRESKASWHDMYKDSAWVFVGGLPYDLSEGDIICVFSQYGEIVNINLVRDKKTGKQKGFCFLCYEDQRSTVLAVDNLNGIKILGRTIRVDHVADYKVPKENDRMDEETRNLQMEGCAPKPQIADEDIKKEENTSSAFNQNIQEKLSVKRIKVKKEKKKKDKRKKTKKDKNSKKKKKRRHSSSSSSESSESDDSNTFKNSEESAGKKKSKKKTRSRSR